MSYLKQKKQKIRKFVFFSLAALLMAILALVFVLYPDFTFLGVNLYYSYFIAWILFFWALLVGKTSQCWFLGGALAVIYVLLAMSVNIWFSDNYDGQNEVNISFSENAGINDEILSKGMLTVDGRVFAHYAIVNEDAPIMLIRVDMRGTDQSKRAAILKNLHKFIVQQGVEVIVFGDFAMYAWSKTFREFIEMSGLRVKNRQFLGSDVANFYIVGFGNIGIKDISINKDAIDATISYDLL